MSHSFERLLYIKFNNILMNGQKQSILDVIEGNTYFKA